MAISKIKINGITLDIKDNSKLPLAGGTIEGDLNVTGTLKSNGTTVATTDYVSTIIETAIGTAIGGSY